MNVFKFEFKMIVKSMIIWSLSLAGFFIFYIAFFPMIGDSGNGFDSIMNSFPPEFQAFFGMTPELPMTSIMGYFALTFGIIQIPLAIQASNYGFHILSVEERELTADFLLSKPIKRSTILFSKLAAIMISLTVVNLLLWISALSGLALFNSGSPINYGGRILVLLSITIFQLYFVGVGMLISVLVKKIPSVLSYSMGLSLGLYMVSSLDTMLSLNVMKYISPYSIFSPSYILIHNSYHIVGLLLCLGIIIASIIGSYFLYQKRNIASL